MHAVAYVNVDLH